MAEFTSGERRGLIVLIAILACLTLVLSLRRVFVHNDAESASKAAEVHIEYVGDSVKAAAGNVGLTVGAVPSDSNARKADKGRKRKSRKTSSPPPAPRNPLDEPLN